MKKQIKPILVIFSMLGIILAAKGTPAWAGVLKGGAPAGQSAAEAPAPRPFSIDINDSGKYTLGGICEIEIKYNQGVSLLTKADVNVPLEESSLVPFGYEGDVYLPGCHIVHHDENGNVVRVADTTKGSWRVCFAERPDIELTVYHYYDEPEDGTPKIWLELETSHQDGLACADAIFTGEYAPGSKEKPLVNNAERQGLIPVTGELGTVIPPAPSEKITESGNYAIGGICSLIVEYKQPELSDDAHVADNLRDDKDRVDSYDNNQYDRFPDGQGLIYEPGCHVVHYDKDKIVEWEMTPEQGSWKICFAVRPDRHNTIYYYLGDYQDQASKWVALETTTEGGMACAPAQHTGVYVPTGK